MGRHSRRGPAPKGGTAETTAVREGRAGRAEARREGHGDAYQPPRPPGTAQPGRPQQPGPGTHPGAAPRRIPGQQAAGRPPAQQQGRPDGGPGGYSAPYGTGGPAAPAHATAYGTGYGTPAHGTPVQETPAQGTPVQGTPAYGPPGYEAAAYGTPPHGVRLPDGTPAQGVPRFPDGTPAHGVPRFADGTPAYGVPRLPDGTPAHGVPQVRGGHPEQWEGGGGWGDLTGRTAAGAAGFGMPGGTAVPLPRQRQAPPRAPRQDHPRQDYVDAFDEADDVFRQRGPSAARPATGSTDPYDTDPYDSVTDWDGAAGEAHAADPGDGARPSGETAQAKGGKGRTFTGMAAAAVTTVLAVVVAGQVTDDREGGDVQAQSVPEQTRDFRDPASRGDDRETPTGAPGARPLTYQQKMERTYPLDARLKGSGKFETVPGTDRAPGKGQKITYRVDVERGLGLDGKLFAEAVHKTLNDQRSWAHDGARTFERVDSGRADFVITLASPGTTADWCAKSGLDTTVDNVSCDSAATERVMINAYRWAQGSETYGDDIHAYRQMLINHEIGHRLGYNHVTCDKDGELAPVMQQQTKFLGHDGISCRPNPWAYPES